MAIFLVPADIFYEEVLYDDFTAADPKHGQELDWLHSHRVQQGLQAPTLGKSAAGVLQKCNTFVTGVFQECYKSSKRVLQECNSFATGVFQEC